jgi:putative transposase
MKRTITMNWRQLWHAGKHLVTRGIQQIETKVKEWTKRAPDRQITGIATDLLRSKPELIAENAFLRQQVIVLKRQITGRPRITQHDRRVLVTLASKLCGWKDALHIVKPDTLTKWHRQGFRLFWRRKSQSQPRKPRISPEAIALIKEMAVKNRLWGSPRIRDELLKSGFALPRITPKHMHLNPPIAAAAIGALAVAVLVIVLLIVVRLVL